MNLTRYYSISYILNKIILITILLSFSPLFSQPKSSKKIYFESLEAKGVKQDVIVKIRNQVSLTILRYFKDKYSFTDDSVVNGLLNQLKKQQKLGCDTDKCYQMIEDFLSPDEKISGVVQFEAGKYELTLKLLDVSKTGGLLEQKSVSFTNSQLEYYVMELTRSLLEPSYSINTSNAPPEFLPGKIELGSIRLEEVQGVDIQILNFKSTDTRTEGILAVLKEELQTGDSFFQKKDYRSALNSYDTILKTIDSSLTKESKGSVREYIEGINKRIVNSNSNLQSERLNEIDKRFLKSTNDLKSLEEFWGEYENLLKVIPSSNEYQTIYKAVEDRLRKLEASIYVLLEREGDSLYDIYRFSEALQKYEMIKDRVLASKYMTPLDSKNIQQKAQKKIKITTETGTSYYGNQIRSYCNFSEKENIRFTLKKNKGEDGSTSLIQENIKKAESILRKNNLIDDETLNYYNSVVKTLNRENSEIANLLYRKDVGRESFKNGDSDESEGDFPIASIPIKPFLFPGLGHLEKNPDSNRGSFYRNTAFVTIGLMGLTYINYTQSYNNYSNTSLLPSLFVTINAGIPAGLYYSEASIKPIRSEYEQSVSLLNGSIGLFGLLYITSLIDYALTDNFKISEGLRIRGMEVGYWNMGGERSSKMGYNSFLTEDRMNVYYKLNW